MATATERELQDALLNIARARIDQLERCSENSARLMAAATQTIQDLKAQRDQAQDLAADWRRAYGQAQTEISHLNKRIQDLLSQGVPGGI